MKSFVVSLIKLESSDIMWLLSLQSVQSTPANQSLSTVGAIVLTTRGRRQPLEEKQMEDIQIMNESWRIIRNVRN